MLMLHAGGRELELPTVSIKELLLFWSLVGAGVKTAHAVLSPLQTFTFHFEYIIIKSVWFQSSAYFSTTVQQYSAILYYITC